MREMYKTYVVDMLQHYMYVRDSNYKRLEDIEYIDTKLTNITGSYGLQTGHIQSDPDEKVLDLIAKKKVLEENFSDNEKLISDVEFGLEGLDDTERDIVLSIYGVSRKDKRDIRALEKKYNYSRSSLYNVANKCLEHISYRIIGDC